MMLSAILCAASPLYSQTPCNNGMAGSYPCRNMDLLSYLPLTSLGGDMSQNTNDVWGWVSPQTKKEYAIVGCSYGSAFLDVSDPINPIYIGVLPTHSINSLWRDVETYEHFLFVVSEAADHGMQAFDLLALDTVTSPPITFEESAHYNGFSNCHTVAIDPASGYAYCNGTNTASGGLHIVDIHDPYNMTLAGLFAEAGYTHDCYAWSYDGSDPDMQGKEIVLACNDNYLYIVDVTNKADCFSIGEYNYGGNPTVGYIHQGWVTKDKSHFLVDDELDEIGLGNDQIPYGTRTHIFNIADLNAVTYGGYYEANSTSIDHNLYALDHFIFESNYRSGVRVLDAIDVNTSLLEEVAYFDLFPTNDFAAFSGTWSNYPYLPSGIVLATSMYDGLFILKPTMIQLSQNHWNICDQPVVTLDLQINANLNFPLSVQVNGIPGVTAMSSPLAGAGTAAVVLSSLNTLNPGIYDGTLALVTSNGAQYEVPITIQKDAPLTNLCSIGDNGIPMNGQVLPSQISNATLAWTNDQGATSYSIDLSSDAGFSVILASYNTTNTNVQVGQALPVGVYHWRVQPQNTCGNGPYAVFSFEVTSAIGVEESIEQELLVYPNPAHNRVQLMNVDAQSPILIFDMQGKCVAELPSGKTIAEWSVRNWAPGVYQVRNGAHTARLVID